ncbi:ACN9-domain-containing protein [Trametopsis cervina]|nr:ACN9-domain-containing protein [Trametopsis cervina]
MFRPTTVRLAKSISEQPLNLQQASAALLPPLPLYRALLRAHRRLPPEMRSLGDDYVKSEFRTLQKVENPLHVIGFLTQWKIYLDELPADPNQEFRGAKLDQTILQKMSAEQIGQLYELMHAAKDVWKPVSELQEQDESASEENKS